MKRAASNHVKVYTLGVLEFFTPLPGHYSVVKDCAFVIHTASPFMISSPDNPDELIKPAVEGTLSVLKACQKAHVQRVVLTSSSLAVVGKCITMATVLWRPWVMRECIEIQ